MANDGDHDILIRLDQKVEDGFDALNSEVKLLRDGTQKRIGDLEVLKIDASVFNSYKADNDKAISILFKNDEKQTKLLYIGMGIILALQFVVLVVKG